MQEIEMNSTPHQPKNGRMRFSLRSLFFVFTIVALLVVGATWFVRSIHYGFVEGPLDCYATMYAAGTVRTYLMRNNDRWPIGWEDLRPIFEERYRLGENAITFDELKQRLEIDFEADSAELSLYEFKADAPPFKVFRLRNGRSSYWQGAEPNTLILEYLKKKLS